MPDNREENSVESINNFPGVSGILTDNNVLYLLSACETSLGKLKFDFKMRSFAQDDAHELRLQVLNIEHTHRFAIISYHNRINIRLTEQLLRIIQ